MANFDDKVILKQAWFHTPNIEAEVIVVGITPGKNQLKGDKDGDASLENKKKYAFHGLRNSIEGMLSYISVDKLLGLDSCHSIWYDDFYKFDFTSLIKDAAFVKSGSRISGFKEVERIEESIKLKQKFDEFVEDCKNYHKAKLFVACGHKVYDVLMMLKEKGVIKVPVVAIAHPSKNNQIRVEYYQGKEEKTLTECKEDSEVAKSIVANLYREINK